MIQRLHDLTKITQILNPKSQIRFRDTVNGERKTWRRTRLSIQLFICSTFQQKIANSQHPTPKSAIRFNDSTRLRFNSTFPLFLRSVPTSVFPKVLFEICRFIYLPFIEACPVGFAFRIIRKGNKILRLSKTLKKTVRCFDISREKSVYLYITPKIYYHGSHLRKSQHH